MRLLALFCTIVWVFTAHATAQTPVLDSLQALVKTTKEDTAKVRLLNRIAYEQSDPVQQRATAERAYALAMRIGDKSGASSAKLFPFG